MARCLARGGLLIVLLVAAGCRESAERAREREEDEVRETFAAVQDAIQATREGNSDKVWGLLAADSKKAAERRAKRIRDDYAKASDELKAEYQDRLHNVSPAELAKLNGKSYLKTGAFYARWWEVPGSTIDRVTVKGDRATVWYLESESAPTQMEFIKEEGEWKVALNIPEPWQE